MAPVQDWFLGLLGRRPRTEEGRPRGRGQAIHVIILDGTMSTLDDGYETNAGITFKLLKELGPKDNVTLHYEAGIQWRDWSSTYGVLTGKGLNRQIERAYGVLASRYVPGDRIFLIGYSRGAYAVRSLAGVIDRVGLVRADVATERNIREAYRHYRAEAASPATADFKRLFCHDNVWIEAVGVWDTVKALGLRLPLLWRFTESKYKFHNQDVVRHVHHAFHALALDETRQAYDPVLWSRPAGWPGEMVQMWFRGSHGDIGGQVDDKIEARPLSNIPLVWILEQLQRSGLPLPDKWRLRFPTDPEAPSVGTWGGWAKLFILRHRREVVRDVTERVHFTAQSHRRARHLRFLP